MNEKVDDIAMAIRDECQKHGYLVSIPDSDRLWGNLARAVKPAMREPTPEMVKAAWANTLAEDTVGVWHDMIDAALK